jgi:DHA1 family tetracycline resistance protein-like MFS transporter
MCRGGGAAAAPPAADAGPRAAAPRPPANGMVLLEAPLPESAKRSAMRSLKAMGMLAVSTQNFNLASDTALITACCGGDTAVAAPLIAATSSASGLIEFLLNPVLGKLADRYGRKPVYYVGPIVSGVGMSLAVLLTHGKNLPVLLVHRALGWALISMSCSFIVPITASDMFVGAELGVNIAQVFAMFGLGVTLAPPLGMLLMQRTGSTLNVYKLRLASALLQLAFLWLAVPETLERSKARPYRLAELSPLRFLALRRAPRTLRTLAAVLFFNFFAEGKNIISLMQVWMVGMPLRWSIATQAKQSLTYGLFMFFGGMHLAPLLIKKLGMRGFTTATNVGNALATSVMSVPLPNYSASFWLGHLIHLPGINNTSAAAVKAIAIDHAVAAGYGRGEWGGMYSSIRTFTMIIAPLIYGTAYAKANSAAAVAARRFAGWPWLLVMLLGAVIPECLHRTLSAHDLEVPEVPKDAPS